jgi:hypothetical protein
MAGDALASWNDTPTKAAILAYVKGVTTGRDVVPPEERIAAFDKDGAPWTEKPMPVELVLILKRWVEMADADPGLRDGSHGRRRSSTTTRTSAGSSTGTTRATDTDLRVLLAAVFGAIAGLDVETYGSGVSQPSERGSTR